MKQLQRYLTLDTLIPSYHNTVTVACLATLAKFQSLGKIESDPTEFIKRAE